MTLEQLRIFVAVAERGHMTKAAELLGISQSAASAAIRSLEEQHGVQLFNRVGRNIELAQTGRRFLPEAKAVLERAAAARNVLEHVAQTVTGSLSISASQTIASYWLPRRLASFHEAYPAVRLSVAIGNTRQVEAHVLDGAADLGLVEGRTESDILRRVKVDVDRLMLVVAVALVAYATHQIAKSVGDTAGGISSHTLILLHFGLIGFAQVIDVATHSHVLAAMEEVFELDAEILLGFYLLQQAHLASDVGNTVGDRKDNSVGAAS